MTAPQATFNMQTAALTQIWSFPKLKWRENYQPWAKKMKSALKYSGLWQIVEQGNDTHPDDLPTDPAPTVAATRAHEASVKAWNEVNNKAAALIYSMCEENPAVAIEDEDVAQNRWEKLEKDYTDYTNPRFVLRFIKLEELWSTSLGSSGNSIETYVANIRTQSKDLKRMGAKIDDWILVSILLKNLGVKYKEFVHRLVTQLDDSPDFDRIVTLLHEEDRRQKRDRKEASKQDVRAVDVDSWGATSTARAKGAFRPSLQGWHGYI